MQRDSGSGDTWHPSADHELSGSAPSSGSEDESAAQSGRRGRDRGRELRPHTRKVRVEQGSARAGSGALRVVPQWAGRSTQGGWWHPPKRTRAGAGMEACKLSFYGPHPQAAWSFEEHLTLAQQHVSVGNKWVSAAPGWPH